MLTLEVALRLTGCGYPTSFFLRSSIEGEPVLIENRKFGWRFFSRDAARAPGATVLPVHKATNAFRVFVFGESAAYGDPQPEFGFPRVLEQMLVRRFPERKIEVVNVAMTAINSHVIRPIAQECAALQGDAWIIYMGNNEAVGPFGPATVFGRQAPPLWLVRTTLALKRSRVVQWFDMALQRMRRGSSGPSTFGGMEMFAENKLASGDPRLVRMYSHFESNLNDILDAGVNSGAEVLLCSVATNLKDCPPFASVNNRRLNAQQLEQWRAMFAAAVTAQAQGNHAEALRRFSDAVRMDDTHAELLFRFAQSHWAVGNIGRAAELFARARDEDALRFRADSKLNEIVRRAATRHSKVRFVDAEKLIAGGSRGAVPGGEQFYEHVHFNFEGNHFLATAIDTNLSGGTGAQLSREQCAERLALNDWKRRNAAQLLAQRTSRPPFTFQFDHVARQETAAREIRDLNARLTNDEMQSIVALYESAILRSPRLWPLRQSAAELAYSLRNYSNAVRHCEALVQLIPHHAEAWSQMGLALDRNGQWEESARAFTTALTIDPDFAGARYGVGLAALRRQDLRAARRAFAQALESDALFHPARIGLAKVFAAEGLKAAATRECEEVLQADPEHRDARVLLNELKYGQNSGLGDRLEELQRAVDQNPGDGVLRLWLGKAFVAAGRMDAAQTNFALAVGLEPSNAEAHYLYGQELARLNQIDAAIGHFRKAVELDPRDAEAHFNLGVALARARRFADAATAFETVVALAPSNTLARQYAESARSQARR